jgi:alpha,alpha-trehalase
VVPEAPGSRRGANGPRAGVHLVHRDFDAVSEFPPHILREYALLADGERGVLVGPRGDFSWMCAPRWDSDAVFSSLIGGAGLYAVTPVDPRFVWGGYYEEGSLIWRSRWITTDGIIECREALAFPGDPLTGVVLRRVTAVEGPARVRVVFDPRAGFGRRPMEHVEQHDARWRARCGRLRVRWSGAERATRTKGGALVCELDLAEGAHHDLVLELSERNLGDPVDPASAWRATEAGWARAVPELADSMAPRDARHAYAVLRGLTRPGGGMVAAATMSLPERAAAGRNYDYRYAWIRDQCYAGQAVAVTEAQPLLDDAIAFISGRLLADGSQLKPAYRITGDAVPDERRLAHLTGYPGGADKVGNWVNHQFQLDAFGESLLLFATGARHDHLDSEHWKAVEAAAEAIETRWGEPDAGIWELDDRHWAHSRLMCVAGLRAIAKYASPAQAGPWSGLADGIAASVAADCVHPTGRWQRAPDDPRVDAALLLAPIRGALPASDPRSVSTLAAVETELAREGYVYRFRHDDQPLEDAEGAFLLCGFLMALGVHQQGRDVEALRWFERNRSACGPSGLLTEEFDVQQRQLRGNVPQAFVHALLLECAARLGRPWEPA